MRCHGIFDVSQEVVFRTLFGTISPLSEISLRKLTRSNFLRIIIKLFYCHIQFPYALNIDEYNNLNFQNLVFP